ncbi:MAG TPA: PmoA family protein [Bryobacteraceae bacterium]|nr:PmoA family protein [Bryobacteraceae bacterium]
MKTHYCFFLFFAPLWAQVSMERGEGHISVVIDNQPFTTLYYGHETAKPYLHPLRSASGKIVTRGYPMENVAGESHDHPHHRGLWFSHGNVNGYDFWSNEPSQHGGKNARIVLKSIEDASGGKQSGRIQATFNWQDPQGKVLLTESRKMVFYSEPARRVVDFDITLTPAGRVTFGDTKEGTFAIRLAPSLEEPTRESLKTPKRTGLMVDSEGRRGEPQVWGHRASWVDYFGEIEGEKLGIAILDHPSNPRHPTYWHSRSYGLFAANIFGLHDFLNDKTADGSMAVEAGSAVRFRYRVIIHSGDFQSAGIAAEYDRYAGQ